MQFSITNKGSHFTLEKLPKQDSSSSPRFFKNKKPTQKLESSESDTQQTLKRPNPLMETNPNIFYKSPRKQIKGNRFTVKKENDPLKYTGKAEDKDLCSDKTTIDDFVDSEDAQVSPNLEKTLFSHIPSYKDNMFLNINNAFLNEQNFNQGGQIQGNDNYSDPNWEGYLTAIVRDMAVSNLLWGDCLFPGNIGQGLQSQILAAKDKLNVGVNFDLPFQSFSPFMNNCNFPDLGLETPPQVITSDHTGFLQNQNKLQNSLAIIISEDEKIEEEWAKADNFEIENSVQVPEDPAFIQYNQKEKPLQFKITVEEFDESYFTEDESTDQLTVIKNNSIPGSFSQPKGNNTLQYQGGIVGNKSIELNSENYPNRDNLDFMSGRFEDSSKPSQKGKLGLASVPAFCLNHKNRKAQRRGNVKSVWNPETVERSRFEDFVKDLSRILRKEITNEEIALKVLQGFDNDCEKVLELVRRKKVEYRDLFEPKLRAKTKL